MCNSETPILGVFIAWSSQGGYLVISLDAITVS